MNMERALYDGKPFVTEAGMVPFLLDGQDRPLYLNVKFYGLLVQEVGNGRELKLLGSDPMKVVVVEGERGQGIIMPVRVS